MKKKIIAAITCLTACLVINVNADQPKGAELLVGAKHTPTVKTNKSTIFRSHSKQIGSIGRYEVHQIKIRGLDVPNLSSAIIYDPLTETLLVIGTTGAPGLGGALINSAGNVGAAAVFGRSIRPAKTQVNNNSGSASGSLAKGGNASANSKSGASANAKAGAAVDVTNINGQTQSQGQEQSVSTDNSGPPFIPPGHQHGHGHGDDDDDD